MLDHERMYLLERERLMTISAAFQAELDRLTAYVNSLKAAVTPDTGPAVTAEETAALGAALDAAGAPAEPAVPVTPAAPTA